VSRTIVDLVAGSDLAFEDRGEHQLRGVPGDWRLWDSPAEVGGSGRSAPEVRPDLAHARSPRGALDSQT
jgi:hypothetical protein